jgi:tRNA1Val (adenine37-N6)-methyltransferase
MSVFRFKKFNVVNERSAMKVNTDGVLLGAVMTITSDDRRLLDIGTGTGTIALMAAQRLMDHTGCSFIEAQDDNAVIRIDAIDIDEPSASEAAANFANSPWADILDAHNLSLNDFAASLKNSDPAQSELVLYDLIFSNPPYFDNALQAPEERRNAARHTSTGLSYREILDFASKNLSPNGRVALVLPADTELDLIRYARMSGLHLFKITRVRTVPRKAPTRIIVEFSRQRIEESIDSTLTIQSSGKYTDEYLALTASFYLFA